MNNGMFGIGLSIGLMLGDWFESAVSYGAIFILFASVFIYLNERES